MTRRESIGLADLERLTLRITVGLLTARPGWTLEFDVREQIGGIEWVCP